MSAQVTRRKAQLPASLSEMTGHLWILEDGHGASATVWPEIGFNLISWKAPVNPESQPGSARGSAQTGETLELIHQDPHLFEDAKPTRSGNPILFPFPNRINHGQYTWGGKSYQLELTGDAGKTAIHGFACRSPWKVLETGADAQGAFLTGEFLLSRDAPADAPHWPAEARLHLTYRLEHRNGKSVLRLEADVDSPSRDPQGGFHPGDAELPFGLGYHPYFTIPQGSGAELQVPAGALWELDACIPTGHKLPLDQARDLSAFRAFEEVRVDDVLTNLPVMGPRMTGSREEALHLRGEIRYPEKGTLEIWCDDNFREVVVYTPPSRDSFCIEPYTCPTNAINMPGAGKSEGWLTLPPGQTWTAINEWTFG